MQYSSPLRISRHSLGAAPIPWVWLVLPMLILVHPSEGRAEPPPSIAAPKPLATPSAVEALVAENRLREASDWMRSVDESQSDVDWTRTLAVIASRYQQQGDSAAAAEFYSRAVVASETASANTIAIDKQCLLRLAAASALMKVSRSQAALGAITWNMDHDPDGHRVNAAAKLMLQIGSQALVAGDHDTAARAYQQAAAKLTGIDLAAAELGHAWSLALMQGDASIAADKLASFATKYPDHADSPQAIEACLNCLRQNDDASAADDVSGIQEKVVVWLRGRIASTQTRGITDRMYLMTLLASRPDENDENWRKCALALAAIDSTGHCVSEALETLATDNKSGDAEHLATMLISPSNGVKVSPASREAACRWAGRSQRWSMLAMAADQETLTSDDPTRTMGVERLFAEGLMQVGRPAEARRWWEHLVDVRGADDFATLLRCAETAVAHAEIPSAMARLERASVAVGEDPFRETLLQMLAADLAIRRLSFDLARSHLEGVVRAPTEVGDLRSRAQWLIGETYLMQQRFAEAVEAYRTVEGLDPESTWVAASLVQAGKAFEQLGRTRDAAVCYSTLLSRHADSPLAQDARRRLAALATTADTTIRR